MHTIIKSNIKEIQEICLRHSVAELYLFGSAVLDSFNDKSDLDFAVLFKESLDPIQHGDAFFGLLDDLEKLFNRRIDLISYRALKNPIFIEEVDNSKVSLYAA
ncbi:MAG: nucleotidyltransferase domain-containing protein [Chitinophagales bacterium]